MWNVPTPESSLNRVAQKYAEKADQIKWIFPRRARQLIDSHALHPAIIVLTSMTAASAQADFATIIPAGSPPRWCFRRHDGFSLGMGIILSFY
jgi:PTS system mannose-specific IIC component